MLNLCPTARRVRQEKEKKQIARPKKCEENPEKYILHRISWHESAKSG
jgi:hypothetical protein